MGRVIGKQGATIKDIRISSQANIQVQETGEDKCEFKIKGSHAAVDKARGMILDIADAEATQNSNDQQGGGHVGGGGKGGAGHAGGSRQDGGDNNSYREGRSPEPGYAGRQANTVEEDIEFPLAFAGRIIGSRGANIKELREQSGATVRVDKFDSHCNVHITGTRDQVEHAQSLVRRLADDAQERSGGPGGPGGPGGHSSRREETMEVPPSMMGRLIGKGGETVNRLQEESGAKIDINTKDQPGMVRINGADDAIAAAKSLIAEILDRGQEDGRPQGGQSSRGPQRLEEAMDVPPSMVGRIIGKGGETIMQLQQDSGAKIDVPKDQPGKVFLSGSRDTIERARHLISILMNQSEGQGRDTDRRGHDGPGSRQSASIEEIMEVPTTMVGRIIGKGGETVMLLQQQSGCKIQVKKEEPGVVRLNGTREVIAQARRLISDIIEGKGGGKGGGKDFAKGDFGKGDSGKGGGKDFDEGSRSFMAGDMEAAKPLEAIEIPPFMVQSFVGRDGKKIRDLEDKSGARIDVDTTTGSFKLRLSGTKKAMDEAQSLIFDAMGNADLDDMPAFDALPASSGPDGVFPPPPPFPGPSGFPGPPPFPAQGMPGMPMPNLPPPPPPPGMGGPPGHKGGGKEPSFDPSHQFWGKGGSGAPWPQHGDASPPHFGKGKGGRNKSASSSSSSSSSSSAKRRHGKRPSNNQATQGVPPWGGWPGAPTMAAIDQDEL